MKLLALAMATALLVSSAGCTHIALYDPATGHKIASGNIPAWPWQDSSQAIQRLAMRSRTNDLTISLSGVTSQETTSTNAVNLIENVVGAAVGAAVRAAK